MILTTWKGEVRTQGIMGNLRGVGASQSGVT